MFQRVRKNKLKRNNIARQTAKGWPSAVIVVLLVAMSSRLRSQELDGAIHHTNNVPEYLIYGALLRGEAAMEAKAVEAESSGKSSHPYRVHFQRALNLTDQEQEKITAIALQHVLRVAPLRSQKAEANKKFREQIAPNGQLTTVPATTSRSPEVRALNRQIRIQILADRDRIHLALGDIRFQYVDALLKARASSDFKKLATLKGEAK